MYVQDLSQNRTVARLTRLTRDLEQSRTPDETLQAVRRGFAEAHGFVATLLLSTRGLGPGRFRVVSFNLEDGPRDGQEGMNFRRRGNPDLVRSGGIIAAVVVRPEPQLMQDVDWSLDPWFHDTFGGYASVIAIPLAGDRLPMNWAILLKKPPERFTASDVEEAVERTSLVGALLENQILAGELARANQRLDKDARQVGEVQRALLPPSLPRIAGLEVAASYEPSACAGGDLYDFFPLDSRHNGRGESGGNASGNDVPSRWCVFVGDAAGHGLATAVVMAIVQAVLHAHPAGMARPAALLMHANRQLCRRQLGGFVTAFLGVYDPPARRLTYTNAGHPPPLLRRSSDHQVLALDEAASYPLGIDEAETFKEVSVQLERGDTLLLYTDGITEARGEARELFGPDRLTRILRDPASPPATLVGRLREAVRSHEGARIPQDDQTLVAARIL